MSGIGTDMEIVARQQPAYEASAYGVIRRALDDPALLSTLWPNLTDDGRRALEQAGITAPEQRDEFLQVLNLAVIGAQQRNTAAQQLKESAQQQGSAANAYAIIRRALDDAALLSKLFPNLSPDGQRALEEAGITGQEQRDELLQILNLAVIGAQQRNAVSKELQDETSRQQLEIVKGSKHHFDETMAVVSTMKAGLRRTINQIDSAFNQTMWMYATSFYLGVALIVAAIVAAWNGKALLPLVLGGLGTANTLAFFFTKPPERLQSSRASLAQLQCALLNWFNDFYNQNTLMAQLNSGAKLDLAPYHRLSETLMRHTEDMMSMLQKYCKLIENPPADQDAPQTVVVTNKMDPPTPADATPPKE